MARIERKYLAHYIDKNFVKPGTQNAGTPDYVRLGKDLEAFAEELNPQVSVQQNILGEQNVIHQGYQVQSTDDPFYAEEGDPLFEQLKLIAEERRTGDACITTRVDVLLTESNLSGNTAGVYAAWREDCWVVPNSYGGDTSGVQIPFTIYNAGNRVKGTFTLASREFAPNP